MINQMKICGGRKSLDQFCCGLKPLFFMLVAAICLTGFGVMIFSGSVCAQNNNNTGFKKQTKQSQVKAGRIITVGDHGQFKGFDGFQMALNMAQDMDETYIPHISKSFLLIITDFQSPALA